MVMMNAGTRKYVTIIPLISPAAIPRRMPSRIATGIGSPCVTMKPTVRVPLMATIAPTERSICPRMMIRVMPSAM